MHFQVFIHIPEKYSLLPEKGLMTFGFFGFSILLDFYLIYWVYVLYRIWYIGFFKFENCNESNLINIRIQYVKTKIQN